MSARRLFALLAVLVVLAGGSGPARGAENTRVLLVFAGAGDAVSAHLVDELVALGLTVEIAPTGELDLAALGKARSARAVLRVMPSKRGIEMWVEGSTAPARIDEQGGESGDAAALALRAVETLRGRLLSLKGAEGEPKPSGPAEEKPTPDKPIADEPHLDKPNPLPPLVPSTLPMGRPLRAPERPTPSPPAPGARGPSRFSMRLGPALLVQPAGGISAAGTAVVGARFMASPRLGVDVVALVPVVPSTIESPEGRVQLAAAAALVGGHLELLDPRGAFGVGVGAGLGAGMLSHFGQPGTARVEARDGSAAYALPYARLGFVWRALSNVGICADVLGAVATPRPVFRLPGRTTDAFFGQPLVSIGLGLEVSLR